MLSSRVCGSGLNSELLSTQVSQFGNRLQSYRNQLSVYLSNNFKQPINYCYQSYRLSTRKRWERLSNYATVERINFELLILFLTLSMQISLSIYSDWMKNGQPPQILGAIEHLRYNEFSVLTNFVLTGFHCNNFP